MATIELFSTSACPFAQRSRMVLAEKALDFELVEIDLGNRPAWFNEISPYGKVPALRHQGRVIYESAVINQYIDESFPDPPLMPADAHGRALARIWMDYCDSRLLPALLRLMMMRHDAEQQADAQAKLVDSLHFIEHEGLRRIGEGPFWMGEEPTLVDFHYLPFFERFPVYEELAAAVWPEDCTRLKLWYQTVSQRQSFIDTRHSPDFHLDQQLRMDKRRAAKSKGR